MASHNELGSTGEALAVKHLEKNGFHVVARNWRYHRYEIDVLARKGDLLAVVEVKTRTGDLFGEPEEGVSRRQERRLAEAADHYIRLNDLDVEVRFDIVSITFFKDRHELHWIEDAFYPFQ